MVEAFVRSCFEHQKRPRGTPNPCVPHLETPFVSYHLVWETQTHKQTIYFQAVVTKKTPDAGRQDYFQEKYVGSHRPVVSGRLGFMSLPTLLVICLYSIVRQKVFTGTPFFPWFQLIYPCSMGELQGLTWPPYVQWLHMRCPCYLNRLKGLPGSPLINIFLYGMYAIFNMV